MRNRAVVLVAVAALAAGCGGGSGKPSAQATPDKPQTAAPQATLLSAVAQTKSAHSAHINTSVRYKGASDADASMATGDGVIDFAHDAVHLSLNTDDAAGKSGTLELRVIDSKMYGRE